MVERSVAAQSVEVMLPERHDVVEVIAGRHRGARHQQQHLGQGIHHTIRLAIVVELSEFLEQHRHARRRKPIRVSKVHHRLAARIKTSRNHPTLPKASQP